MPSSQTWHGGRIVADKVAVRANQKGHRRVQKVERSLRQEWNVDVLPHEREHGGEQTLGGDREDGIVRRDEQHLALDEQQLEHANEIGQLQALENEAEGEGCECNLRVESGGGQHKNKRK